MKYLILILQINCFLFAVLPQLCSQNISDYFPSTVTEKVYFDIKIALLSKESVFRLNLNNQELTQIPDEMYLFPNLEHLILDENKINSVKFREDELKNLVYLSLKENNIREFVIPVQCMPLLKTLNLDINELIQYPEINSDMIELETLSLRNNYITMLPIEDLTLSRLRYLYLDNNPIRNCERSFYYSSILETLSLHKTGLKSIPEELPALKISKLILSENPFEIQSLNLIQFPHLEYLDLSSIELNENIFPDAVISLKTLKFLMMENMEITSLPPTIKKLKKLKEFSLLGNKIEFLPDEFYTLKLKVLNLRGNPISLSEKNRINMEFAKSNIHW